MQEQMDNKLRTLKNQILDIGERLNICDKPTVKTDNANEINIKCVCGDVIGYSRKPVYIIFPCEHLIHQVCYHNYFMLEKIYYIRYGKTWRVCPFCHNVATKIYPERIINFIIKNPTKTYDGIDYKQAITIWKDINSTRYEDKQYKCRVSVANRSPRIIKWIVRLLNLYDKDLIYQHFSQLFELLNVRISVVNRHLDRDITKIYICNHKSYLDGLVLYNLLHCGLIASDFFNKGVFHTIMQKAPTPLLFITRGEKGNSVDKMKKYLQNKNHNKICVFPEGMITNEKTMIKFRTGAFYVGVPLQPILIEYENLPQYIPSMGEFIDRLIKQKPEYPVNVKVTFLDIIDAPNEKDVPKVIEDVRQKMARAGNLYLSRVSNRAIKD